ncbi:Type 1 glutamine amidotransferase-like domain-containing protein [Halobacillus yeomjeoni]|uniref:Type 1 glutamine amidotransferase-like domain-containing protein n=1 Tax=Halobacillus yeomjeoni TaxID=311194 RepID=UPI001CD1C840|nr:Type 1 glutamine amidotransferase-like domain-containing protein [Halobacillus yeomjeoni]MCA0982882.1 Type 1 glutamine amidotransferase-like domain-containing protein [Halobacillus yeomjeoni]
MTAKHLFLFGGSPPFNDTLGEKFAKYAGNEKGKVAILFIEREGWKEYMKIYTSVLKRFGLKKYEYIALSSSPSEEDIEQVKTSSGIIISGGATELYRSYIVKTGIGVAVKELYENGVPVAGFSAGALIAPEHCVIPPIDNSKNKQLFLSGLGLIKNCTISVHYTKWNEEQNLRAAIEKLRVPIGYGIDDEGSIYFRNEKSIECDSHNYYVLYHL